MTLKEAVNNPYSSWMAGDAEDNTIIISSRIRLARNMQQLPFPVMAQPDTAEQVVYAVRLALKNSKYSDFEVDNLNELSAEQMQILVAKHLISPDLVPKADQAAIALAPDEKSCIMLNEEDHIRIQCLLPGLQLSEAWLLANDIDDQLEKTLDYAFSEQVGYITTCPTNIGTGMRASVMLHLPALTSSKQMPNILNAVSKLGMTIRGLYGEGTEALGDIFQISNQVTLGQTEQEIINSLLNLTKQIVEQERNVQTELYQRRKYYLEDQINRAYGTLTNARMLGLEETMQLISQLRLGLSLKCGPAVKQSDLNKLMVISQPAFLDNEAGKKLNQLEQAVHRADLCCRLLK